MCVLSLPKVMSYEIQVMKKRRYLNLITPDDRQATEAKLNTQSNCIAPAQEQKPFITESCDQIIQIT